MKKILGRGLPARLHQQTPEYRFTMPEVTDVSGQEGIRLEVELLEEGLAEIEVGLYPLRIARPEFFPSVRGSVAVEGKGVHLVELPFEQFGFRQMVRAFLNYLDGVSVKLISGVPVEIKAIEADVMGTFSVHADKVSGSADGVEWVEYPVLLSNRSGRKTLVNVRRVLYGKECLPVEYDPYVAVDEGTDTEYKVKVKMKKDVPPGGLEKSSFLFVPDGNGGQAKKLTFQTEKRREHPYLFLTGEMWERRKAAILADEGQYRDFCRKYVEAAENWVVPEVSGSGDYVYPSYSQNGLFQTVAAWKITGKEAYREKGLRYLTGLLDEEKGYLATRKSYFEFIENKDEYARGDFKVCRAQSAGWVQEAEFFNKTAMSYDLLYDYFTADQHRQMEACLENYMKFASWRLTDGDGNNFQVAECGAGLLCAFVLQRREWADRFLYGYNGFDDLLSSVLLDDGMYFEEASGYVRLAGELFFDIVNAAENYGISLKDRKVPASFDRDILHSPWAMRETWAEDGKPFLGMSFRRFEGFTKTARSVRDYFDCTAKLLTDQGILFSMNDSNEQDFSELYQKAYYLYREPLYGKIAAFSHCPETLLVPEEKTAEWGKGSLLLPGAGLGILRDGSCQAVLKFGGHGGYHGHYDRLSLASFLKGNQTFHNNEYAWFGYDSFLFKMWVQTSVAHNMTVVDGRMQKPSPCECVYYVADGKVQEPQEADGKMQKPQEACGKVQDSGAGVQDQFCAVCAQTTTVWMDPPYGGQTPYPYTFPEEKCRKEGRSILMPGTPRRQGEIGDYSEPVFQRRLIILFHGYCVLWDYLEGEEEHRYDCLYHPMGRFDRQEFEEREGVSFTERERFSEDPFGAGQFIQNCYTVRMEGEVCLRFRDAVPRVNGNDIIDNLPETVLWRAWPTSGEVTLGKYPQKTDRFTEENRKAAEGYLEEPLKKTVAFTVRGKSAEFVTILEAGERTGKVRAVSCDDYNCVIVTEDTGDKWRISVTGMAERKAEISVSVDAG